MPHIQAYFQEKEFEEVELFLLLVKKKNWTKQKLLKRAVLEYIRKEGLHQPKVKEQNHD